MLEGIYFYNFTTPEFNVNVCQIPFWSLTVYYSWQSFKNDKVHNWVLFGFFAGLGVLSKYLFIYLLIGIKLFFIYYLKKNKKFNFKYFIPIIIFLIVLTPHFIWLVDNRTNLDYQTIDKKFLEKKHLEEGVFQNPNLNYCPRLKLQLHLGVGFYLKKKV